MPGHAVALPIGSDPRSAELCGPRVRVVVIDDEDIVRCGFRLLLGTQAWAERCLSAPDVASGLELARRFEPHVALVDPGTLDRDPAAFARALGVACPRTRILILTHADAVSSSTLRASGAVGFVSRRWAAGDLLRTIRIATVSQTIPMQRAPNPTTTLSARQQEVLQLIAEGATNEEIAGRLYLSRHTVKQHTSALYRKLNARNRIHAVQTARRQGLLAA
jgi:DNA-binding NarL/FixJ family response regulator